MKIISWNVNGLRSIYKKKSIYKDKNFVDWLKQINADIICLQEIKAQKGQLPPEILRLDGYHLYLNSAEKPGYSGVAVYAKKEPIIAETKIGWQKFDNEGRLLILEYPKFVLFNLYVPHGGRAKENLVYKLEVYRLLLKQLASFKDKQIILVGDFNIAHRETDLARPKQNKNNIMFTPEERGRIDDLIAAGFVDTFRKLHRRGGNYTWWPYSNKARERNIGWRIDYIFTSEKLISKVKEAFILKDVLGSDHCPVGIEIKV